MLSVADSTLIPYAKEESLLLCDCFCVFVILTRIPAKQRTRKDYESCVTNSDVPRSVNVADDKSTTVGN